MAKTSLIIDTTNLSGKKVQKSVTDVNPQASNQELATFGTMVAAMTTHVYGSTTRIDKVNCDTEAGKATPTFTITNQTQSAATFINNNGAQEAASATQLIYNGDGLLTVDTDALREAGLRLRVLTGSDSVNLFPSYSTAPTFPVTFDVGFTETATYKACSATITITA